MLKNSFFKKSCAVFSKGGVVEYMEEALWIELQFLILKRHIRKFYICNETDFDSLVLKTLVGLKRMYFAVDGTDIEICIIDTKKNAVRQPDIKYVRLPFKWLVPKKYISDWRDVWYSLMCDCLLTHLDENLHYLITTQMLCAELHDIDFYQKDLQQETEEDIERLRAVKNFCDRL